MGQSRIEWTEQSWTVVVGCEPVSAGCAKCYMASMAARLERMGVEKYSGLSELREGRAILTGTVRFWQPSLLDPLRQKKPARWFLSSMGDIGHATITDDELDQLFAVMSRGAQHEFYVLSKRVDRIARYLRGEARADTIKANALRLPGEPGSGFPWPLPNVLIGTSVENQVNADLRHAGMACLARGGWRTMVSYEPALGPVDWSGWEFLSWLISGGETDHMHRRARPHHPAWHLASRGWAESPPAFPTHSSSMATGHRWTPSRQSICRQGRRSSALMLLPVRPMPLSTFARGKKAIS